MMGMFGRTRQGETVPYHEPPYDDGSSPSLASADTAQQPDGRVRRTYTLVISFVAATCALSLAAFAGYSVPKQPLYTYSVSVPGTASTTELVEGAWPALSNVTFFSDVEHKLKSEGANFIVANLSTMNLSVYRNGEMATSVPIKSKGKEGSWWETPAGLYKAESKAKNHFSSFGQVNMPWSIPFQGNFFIHGWPTYPDGTPVASTYSGGCIRLEDSYAKAVYELTDVGMPILVYEDDFSHDNYRYRLNAPDIAAQSYLVADLKNGFILLTNESEAKHHATLAAKLMGALVASEYKNIEGRIAGPETVSTSTHMRFTSGATYSLYDLLFPLLLENSDAAAEAIAASFGRDRFVELMNGKARALGMHSTTFAEPTGSMKGNETTAEDFYVLARYLYNNRPFVLSLTAGTLNTAWYGKPVWETMEPTHRFASTTGFLGGIASETSTSGERVALFEQHTEQHRVPAAVLLAFATSSATVGDVHEKDMVSIFSLTFGGVNRPVLFVALDSPDPTADTAAMLEYVRRMYK